MNELEKRAMEEALDCLINAYNLQQIDDLIPPDAPIKKTIALIRQALANEAIDRMAENARELGLDYDPAGGTQVSKVWWDGDKLMAKPIPLSEVYKEPEQQPADEPFAWCIESIDSADWCFAKTKEGVESNAVFLDEDYGKTEPFPLYTRPQPAAQCEYIRHTKEGTHWCALAEKTAAWVGLTDEERNHARQTITYSQLAMTAGEWAEAVQIETERRIKEKNT